jgi:hypothetical protein
VPNSARFARLLARLDELRTHLLPQTFSATGDYTAKELDAARGYRLLVHAEIEAFLEDIAGDTVQRQFEEWRTTRTPSGVLMGVMAMHHVNMSTDDDEAAAAPPPISPKTHVDEVIGRAVRSYQSKLGSNNGIKIQNLKNLFMPLTVNFDALDETWLTNMDSFGKRRGDIAHKSGGVHWLLDPQGELQDVRDNLLSGLRVLDEIVLALA